MDRYLGRNIIGSSNEYGKLIYKNKKNEKTRRSNINIA